VTDQGSPWDGAYRMDGGAPWDIGRPQPVFVRLADAGAFEGPALDAGCGTGEHALLLASRGLEAVGVDISAVAVERARAKARDRGIEATFQVGDVRDLASLGRSFRTVIDSGTFHTFDPVEGVAAYVAALASVVERGGVVHLLCFSDRQPGTAGPRRVTQAELRDAFADGWSVESIEPATFVVNPPIGDAQAWLARIVRTP
jgi:cyclopropane fatty-acyl-phospholipid synthase-like methyltransferase